MLTSLFSKFNVLRGKLFKKNETFVDVYTVSDGCGYVAFVVVVVENTLFREDAALFTLFVLFFTLSEICSIFYLVSGSFYIYLVFT